MKKLLFLAILLFGFFEFNAQSSYLSKDERLVGDNFELAGGVHIGAFDCNQTTKYPYNLGAVFQFNYIPDVTQNWFFGTEIGAFYASGKADDYDRKIKDAILDFSFYPGLSFPLGSSYLSEDNPTVRLKKMVHARKFRIGAGFTIAVPLSVASEGVGVNTDIVKAGFGFSLRTSFDLGDRLSLFANASRIGKDLDGLGFVSSTSSEPVLANEHNVTYYYKLGVVWYFKR
ncbi:MAG: hypothetical protein R2771_12645 [Saprospiraceae bacterium]